MEQNTTRKERVDKNVTEFKAGNSKMCEIEAIWNSIVYVNKVEGYLLGLYYLLAWKKYSGKRNTEEPSSVVQYLKKMINSFYKKHPEKPIATSLLINSTLPIARPTVKPTRPSSTKEKQGQLANYASKQGRNWVLDARNIWTIPLL